MPSQVASAFRVQALSTFAQRRVISNNDKRSERHLLVVASYKASDLETTVFFLNCVLRRKHLIRVRCFGLVRLAFVTSDYVTFPLSPFIGEIVLGAQDHERHAALYCII